MKVYQMVFRGRYKGLDGSCRVHSAKVFRHYPTDDERDRFRLRCFEPYGDARDIWLPDPEQAHEVGVLELYVLD